jgi:hypothetical protein
MKQPVNDKRFFHFARSYLREAFPNPERVGCPAEEELRKLVETPLKSDVSITEHLSCCSPCYSQYSALLEEQKRRLRSWIFGRLAVDWRVTPTRLAWASAAVLLLVAAIVWVFLWRAPQSTYSAFTLDLRSASESRGTNTEQPRPEIRIPRRPLNLKIQLPLGSKEGAYLVSLASGQRVVWSHQAEARLIDHTLTLEVHADLRPLHTGRYQVVLQSGLERIEYPVLIARP